MPAYIKLGDIKGEATDQDHKNWIIIDTINAPISRSIPAGAKDQQRTQGETTLGDVAITRQVDSSSPKLAEACAAGKFVKEVEIHLCSTIKGKQQPYYKYLLKNVIVSSYSFSGNAAGSPLPTEAITLGFSDVEWTYIILDSNTGDVKGNVPAKYAPGTGKAG